MIKKIIGVTVGTTMNPKKIAWNAEHSHSWNDLTDKPFFEVEGETVEYTFDGDVEKYENVPFEIDSDTGNVRVYYVKIADEYYEPSQLAGAEACAILNGKEYSVAITEDLVAKFIGDIKELIPIAADDSGYMFQELLLFIKEPITIPAGEPPYDFEIVLSRGIWTIYRIIDQIYYKSLTITGEEQVKQLDEKFIPDTIATKEYVHQLLGTNIEDIASLIGGDA